MRSTALSANIITSDMLVLPNWSDDNYKIEEAHQMLGEFGHFQLLKGSIDLLTGRNTRTRSTYTTSLRYSDFWFALCASKRTKSWTLLQDYHFISTDNSSQMTFIQRTIIVTRLLVTDLWNNTSVRIPTVTELVLTMTTPAYLRRPPKNSDAH